MARLSGLSLCVATLLVLGSPTPVLACETYTFSDEDDGFGLGAGIQWAFAGEVSEELPNPEIPNRPLAVVIRVVEQIVASVDLAELRIEQDAGCDGFWYRPGDEVIAAIGRLRGVEAPFLSITNYAVAVWVIRDGQVARPPGPHSRPWIGGRAPATEDELRVLLIAAGGALTPTALSGGSSPTGTATGSGGAIETGDATIWAVLFVAIGAGLGAFVAGRWLRRPE